MLHIGTSVLGLWLSTLCADTEVGAKLVEAEEFASTIAEKLEGLP